ncbi:DUF6228 family protein [Acidipropionibacterium acidipropionici]|uniref:DUF6228 family protein n=2 Tax=Acidipropionibacterium acidipropionici TaxID=1748 RepID=UPI0038B24AF1
MWQGVREWESLEGDMRIEANHHGGHIQLRVTLRRDTPLRMAWGALGDHGRSGSGAWRAAQGNRRRASRPGGLTCANVLAGRSGGVHVSVQRRYQLATRVVTLASSSACRSRSTSRS